jgi:hypothetical protein
LDHRHGVIVLSGLEWKSGDAGTLIIGQHEDHQVPSLVPRSVRTTRRPGDRLDSFTSHFETCQRT